MKLEFDEDSGESYITNLESETRPAIIHGNGPSKIQLNNFGNYLAGSFVFSRCVACEENVIEIAEVIDFHHEIIALGILSTSDGFFFF